jgi:hypothetical protein
MAFTVRRARRTCLLTGEQSRPPYASGDARKYFVAIPNGEAGGLYKLKLRGNSLLAEAKKPDMRRAINSET